MVEATRWRGDDLEAVRRRLDGPRPPERVRFHTAFPVGQRWKARGFLRAVEELMAGRPYQQVTRDVGTDAELVARHSYGHGVPAPPRPARRTRVVHVLYVSTETDARVPARVLAR